MKLAKKQKLKAFLVKVLPRICIVLLLIYGWNHFYLTWLKSPQVDLVRILKDEPLTMPTMLREFPDHQRFAVLEKRGVIKWFQVGQDKANGVLLDIQDKVFSDGYEEGLLSIAFDPKFFENHFIYIFYSLEKPLRSRISRFKLENMKADLSSELILLEIPKPNKMHNGGMLEFGPDGYLYISIGEGSFSTREEADLHLQSKKTFYGTILRIDPQGATRAKPYAIPPTNPFANAVDDTKKEIFATGFRNPWRFSFDVRTGELYVNDVGGVRFEEINLIKAGGDYGWPIAEGFGCRYSTDHGVCKKAEKQAPLAAFSHKSIMLCITGGVMYRGNKIPKLQGLYVASSFTEGLFATPLPKDDTVSWARLIYPPFEVRDGRKTDRQIKMSALDTDHEGELYVVNYEGSLYKVVPLENPKPWQSFADALF